MGRYKGRLWAKNIERTCRHIVEITVPEYGRLRKSDATIEWHRKRGLQSRGGQGSYREPVTVRQFDAAYFLNVVKRGPAKQHEYEIHLWRFMNCKICTISCRKGSWYVEIDKTTLGPYLSQGLAL